jgi:hypothetical protein
MSKTVKLEILSYRGVSIGAEHWYGYLQYYTKDGKFKRDKIRYKISSRDAKELNKKDDTRFGSFRWKKGMESSRFADRYSLIERAIEIFNEEFVPKGYTILLKGTHADPCEVLACTDLVLFNKLNKLNEQAEAVGRWQGDEKQMHKICREWDKLIGLASS